MDELSAIVDDFRWLPARLDSGSNTVLFAHADRETHRSVTFLGDELLNRAQDRRQIDYASLAPAAAKLPPSECHFIFHSAFCCSTLLARAFDIPGKAMALKEPVILNDLVQAAFASGRTDSVRDPLRVALNLLARPFSAGEKVLVKPSNAANPLIGEIMDERPSTRALFLSSALPEFLRSVAKKGLFGRIWARRLLISFDRMPQFEMPFSQAERWEHSDLQVAALAWLNQRAQFAKLLARLPCERAASLDSSDLLSDPRRTLKAVAEFFELGLSEEEVVTIAGGPVFASDSKKHGQAFDADRRQAEHQAIDEVVGEEIAMVAKWAESVAAHAGVSADLPNRLID